MEDPVECVELSCLMFLCPSLTVDFYSFGTSNSAVGIFNAIWLMIVYATSQTASENEDIDDGVVRTTIAYVPEQTPRLIATTLAAYVFFGYAMKLILEEFDWFIEMRHKFLRKAKPRNYSVFVRNIPEQYRNNVALVEFMRSCFSHDAVLEARVAYTASKLGKVESDRETTMANLEHALAEYEITGTRPKHKNGKNLVADVVPGAAVVGMAEAVDSIDTYKQELSELNEQVDKGMSEIEEKIVSSGTMPEWGSHSQPLRSFAGNDEVTSMLSHDMDLENKNEGSKKEDEGPITIVGGALNNVGNLATGVVGGALGQAGNLAAGAVNLLTGGEDGVAYPAGFVVFNKLATANAALQMVHHSKPFSMEICEAPDPDDSKLKGIFF